MAKQQNVTYTSPHTSKANPQVHVDVMSRSSDQAKPQKAGHANIYSGEQPVNSKGNSGSKSK
jgi:hypothetical protein